MTTPIQANTVHEMIRQFLLQSDREKNLFIAHMTQAILNDPHQSPLSADVELRTYFSYDVFKVYDTRITGRVYCREHNTVHHVDPLLVMQILETFMCQLDETALINEFVLREGFTDPRPRTPLTQILPDYGHNSATNDWWMIANNDGDMYAMLTEYATAHASDINAVAAFFQHVTMLYLDRYLALAPLFATRKLLMKQFFAMWVNCVEWVHMARNFVGRI